jgi:ABC-type bacteriocin/lantibiotic exporter with double-glycine peptidase domain
MQRLFRLLVTYRIEIRFIILYSIVAGLINLSLPLGIQAIIGLIAGGTISASWGVLVLFVMAGALLAGILRLMQLSLMEHIQRRLFADASAEFALRFPRLNLEQLRHEYMPELANRFFDTLTLQKGLPKLLIDGSAAILQIVFSLLLLSFYHPIFVFFSFILLLVVFLLFCITAPRGVSTSLTESKYKYKLAYWLEELGRVSVTFKLAGENNYPLERADQLTNDYLNARMKHWRILMIQFVSSITFKVLCLGGFLILGSFLVMENELNLGQFVASEILILFVVESVDKLIMLHETGN